MDREAVPVLRDGFRSHTTSAKEGTMAKTPGKARGPKQTETKAIEPKQKPEPEQKAGPVTAPAPRERSRPAASPPSPFAVMRRLADEMDRLFGAPFGASSLTPRFDLPWESREGGEGAWMPSVEVAERGGKLVIRADLPGLKKEDVKVEVRDDVVCIEGERRQEREEKRKGFYRSERSYGRFYREVPLPEGIDPEQASASFKNGVLEVTMPAPPRPAKGRRVPIGEG
jgi:HSP20 family protein